MLKTVLIAAAVAALAAPAFAKPDKPDAAYENPNGPIPYSDLAAADAKINGGGPAEHKKHMAKKHMAKKPADAPAPAPAQ
jgi:hypothetical protein